MNQVMLERVWNEASATLSVKASFDSGKDGLVCSCIPGLAGIGLESMPIPVVRELVSFVVPGQEIFLFSYLLIALIGLGSMTYAAFAYSIRRIRPFEGIRMLAFALCFAGYLSFFLNLFPWVFVWMLMIVYTERKESQVEH